MFLHDSPFHSSEAMLSFFHHFFSWLLLCSLSSFFNFILVSFSLSCLRMLAPMHMLGFKATSRRRTASALRRGVRFRRSSSQAPLLTQGRPLRLLPLLQQQQYCPHRHQHHLHPLLEGFHALPRCACSCSSPNCCRTLRGQPPFVRCSQRPLSGVPLRPGCCLVRLLLLAMMSRLTNGS